MVERYLERKVELREDVDPEEVVDCLICQQIEGMQNRFGK